MTSVDTGGVAESILYDDIDRMFFRHDILVVANDESDSDINNDESLCLLSIDEEDCYPGFCRLKLQEVGSRFNTNLFQKTDVGIFLSGEKLKYFLLDYYLRTAGGNFRSHGPALNRIAPTENRHAKIDIASEAAKQIPLFSRLSCEMNSTLENGLELPRELYNISTIMSIGETEHRLNLASLDGDQAKDKDQDLVASVKCVGWPVKLKGFLSRMEKLGYEIASLPHCLFVSKSHPISNHANIEFRYSFSLLERFLIRKWTGIQINLYVNMKSTKRGIYRHYESETEIPSYFIKTAMFWLIENKPNQYWESSSHLNLQQGLIQSILDMIVDGNFPNYFIPEQNLIEFYTRQEIEEIKTQLLYANDAYDSYQIVLTDFVLSDQIKGYISDFIHFCLEKYTRYDYINSVLLEEVIRSIPSTLYTDENDIQQCIKAALTECLALYKLYDAFEDEFSASKDYLIEESRQLLLMQPKYPDFLITDDGITKFVLLGILYYIKGDRFWSQTCLLRAYELKNQLSKIQWYYAAYPIHLSSSKKGKLPLCLRNEPISLLWSESIKPNDVHFIDPYGLCLYFLFRLTGDKKYFKMLKETDDIFIWSRLTKYTLVDIMELI